MIEGNGDAGDVLLDTSGNFSLQNITLRPASGQVGLIHHEGNLTLEKVTFEGKDPTYYDEHIMFN